MCFLCLLSECGDGGIINTAIALIPVSGWIQLQKEKIIQLFGGFSPLEKQEMEKKKNELPDSESEFTDQGSQNVNSLLSKTKFYLT